MAHQNSATSSQISTDTRSVDPKTYGSEDNESSPDWTILMESPMCLSASILHKNPMYIQYFTCMYFTTINGIGSAPGAKNENNNIKLSQNNNCVWKSTREQRGSSSKTNLVKPLSQVKRMKEYRIKIKRSNGILTCDDRFFSTT